MSTTDRILLLISALGMVGLFAMVFLVIPEERTQGFVQKIFYVHVPAAWVAFFAFGVTGYKGFRYLMTHELCHTRHMNHSRAFWSLVASYEPDYRAYEARLDQAWRVIPGWVGMV